MWPFTRNKSKEAVAADITAAAKVCAGADPTMVLLENPNTMDAAMLTAAGVDHNTGALLTGHIDYAMSAQNHHTYPKSYASVDEGPCADEYCDEFDDGMDDEGNYHDEAFADF